MYDLAILAYMSPRRQCEKNIVVTMSSASKEVSESVTFFPRTATQPIEKGREYKLTYQSLGILVNWNMLI